MKTIIKNLMIGTINILLVASCVSEYRAVREKPQPATVVVKPVPQPYPGAVLVGPEWRWKHGRYVYVAPHYVHPRKARVWVPGHWRNSPRGFVWIKGHWR
jgi:hypothetical protein